MALLAAVRLVYMNDEPAHLYGVHNILYRHGSDDIRRRAVEVRAWYKACLEGGHAQMSFDREPVPGQPAIELSINGRVYQPLEVLDAFRNGIELHQALDKQPDGQRLMAVGPVATFLAHGMVLALAGCVLDMDDVVTDFLGEPRLPRITAQPVPLSLSERGDDPSSPHDRR